MARKKKEVVPEVAVEEAPEWEMVVVEPMWLPNIGERALFVNEGNEFIASVECYDPLDMKMHFIRGGCVVTDDVSIDSLDDYRILPLTAQEAEIILEAQNGNR